MTLNILLEDTDKPKNSRHFVQVYQHPKYVAHHMSGVPHEVMRFGSRRDDDQTLRKNKTSPLKRRELLSKEYFEDDDFFQIHKQEPAFERLLDDYTFILKYTGSRWYGQIAPPFKDAKEFNEEEFHAFWSKSFSGKGKDDNAT